MPEQSPSRAHHGLEFVEDLNRGDSGTGADHLRDILTRLVRLPQPTTLDAVKAAFRSRDEVMLVVILTRAVEVALFAASQRGQHPVQTCRSMSCDLQWGGRAHCNQVPLSFMLAFARALGLARSHLGPMLQAEGIDGGPAPPQFQSTILRLQMTSVRKGGEGFAPVVALLMEGLMEGCKSGILHVKVEASSVLGIAHAVLLGLCVEIVTREEEPDEVLVAAAVRWRDLISTVTDFPVSVRRTYGCTVSGVALNEIWKDVVSCCNPRNESISSDSRLYRRLAPVLQLHECGLRITNGL